MRKHFTPGVALGVIAIVLAMSGSAVAGSLITSAKIKDGTIQNKDIKKGTIALNRLTPATQRAIRLAAKPGATGATGAAGATGATGAAGAPGANGRPGTTFQASPGVRRPPATGASSTATPRARRPRTCAPARSRRPSAPAR